MSTVNWPPSAPASALRARARLYSEVRRFFEERSVLEVATPLLGSGPAPDPFIENLEVRTVIAGDERTLFLQTSPELAMKRLIAGGSGSIYQICKAFRAGEVSRQHNPEFTMLEWYRVGWDHHELMSEVADLVRRLCDAFGHRLAARRTVTYRELFLEHLAVDPLTSPLSQLEELLPASRRSPSFDRDDVLGLLLSDEIEPALDRETLWFVHDFPASQAALAKITTDGSAKVAERFEDFFGGLELANGYHELTDVTEQRRRLEDGERRRRVAGLPRRPMDERFLAALDAGLPECAGVALGLDRLLMVLLDEQQLDAVLSFPIDRA